MGKLLLSLAALLLMSFGPAPSAANEGTDRMPLLSIKPSPLKQGQTGTVTGNPGDVIDLDWDPPAEPSSVTIGDDGKATFKTPKSATSVIATDPDGNTVAVAAGP